MDRSDYITQVKEMLQDSKVYKTITDKRRNPTTRTENDLQKMLKTLCDSGHLSELDYWKLRPFDSTAAAFYGLPKVHKIPLKEEHDHFTIEKKNLPTQIPLRPINSSIGHQHIFSRRLCVPRELRKMRWLYHLMLFHYSLPSP
ncbi:Hypothetical predicted protein [Paramuricea clavata]|uniref:Uncharacterized protein n=1 Tax=Paramuricea clavata TaxID=317549 RepID=A0A7D9JHD7_PARCT|nr:Hypothetical predicted protein [Paramuricea clavata]